MLLLETTFNILNTTAKASIEYFHT